MKSLPIYTSVTVLGGHVGDRRSPGLASGNGLMLLTEVHDQEILHLPEIRLPGKSPAASPTVKRHGRVSRSFQHPKKPDHLLKFSSADARRALTKSLIGISEESFDSDGCSSPKLPKEKNVCVDHDCNDANKTDEASKGSASHKLLTCRENLQSPSFRGCGGANSSQTTTHKLGTHLTTETPNRPYQKSHSSRELQVDDMENCLPIIFTSKRSKFTRSRSSSVLGAMPKLPAILTRNTSTSQPDVSNLPTSSPSSSSSPPSETSSPTQARRHRVRTLWRTAGQKLGVHQENGEEEEGWTQGPGGLLRPVYTRWDERRHALAEPERMCMPQEVRERIQKDVQTRKRSIKRRMSNFLTVKFGLNMEEDLVS